MIVLSKAKHSLSLIDALEPCEILQSCSNLPKRIPPPCHVL